MNRRNLLKKLPSCLLGALFVACVASTTMVHAVDGNPPGLFELEGNTLDDAGVGTYADVIESIGWAIDNGARIINYSGGGDEFSEEEYLAIKKAEAKGVLFIAAAGNEHEDTDKVENYYYPAAYRVSNLISVAATDIHNNLLASSNWGKTRVDVAAPGENIYSTTPKHKFGYMSGTSQATAFVTGLAALLLSKDPSLTPQQIREIIMASVDPVPALKDRIVTGGRVNAFAALSKLTERTAANRALAVGPSKSFPFVSATR